MTESQNIVENNQKERVQLVYLPDPIVMIDNSLFTLVQPQTLTIETWTLSMDFEHSIDEHLCDCILKQIYYYIIGQIKEPCVDIWNETKK